MKETEFKPASTNHLGGVPGSGSGMDRKVEKKKWPPRRIAMVAGIAAFILLVSYGLWTQRGGAKLRVEVEKLTIATVETGAFQEYIPVIGTVEPLKTVYLDAAEGGRVEEVFVEEGAMLEAGDPIVRLTNNDLQLDLLNREAQFYETMNYLRTARLAMEQNTLNLREQIVETNYQLTRLERQHTRNIELHEKGLISDDEFEQVSDELDYTA